jgi:ribose transport system ATP-binding protein
MTPLLACLGIGKRFGGEVALEDVDFSVAEGEIHGLVGSNGAGKSTLMKILAGALSDHSGEIQWQGRTVRLSSPRAASRIGIAMVYQELSGIPQLTVAENLFLGRQPVTRWGRIDWRSMYQQAANYLEEMQIEVDVRQRLGQCPLVVRQMIEIARGLHSGARLLILDEPTSSLSPPETAGLFALMRQLAERGVAIVFISHFLEDVLKICQHVTVLRDGRRVETRPAHEFDKQSVIHAMLGRGVTAEEVAYEEAIRLPPRSTGTRRLRVEGLRSPHYSSIDLEVAEGECVGLYGFVGAGHQELAQSLGGARLVHGGKLWVDGQPLVTGDVHRAVQRGVVLVAADRGESLVSVAPIYQNTTLAHLRHAAGDWLTRRRELRVAEPVLRRVGLRPLEPRLPVNALSGGNQQKVVLAKWLLGPIRVLILEEPTRGMDVGAKEEIMNIVRQLRDEGVAIVLATTEPELALAYADRILVFHRGQVSMQFSGQSVDRATLMRSA